MTGPATEPPREPAAAAAGHGPLAGVRVVEMAAVGPAPFCAMLLADMGAAVTRVERPGPDLGKRHRADSFGRGKRSAVIDVTHPDGLRAVRALAGAADVLIEGQRPGVMERLGLGPADVMTANPRLVYARMTGWGQDGPMAEVAGHDINYTALAGALEPVGRAGERPVPPLALVGDFGGGAMSLALGICAALVERTRSGLGQVVDASCLDGASLLMTVVHHLRAAGRWRDERGSNLFDTGAPFYEVYQTRDGRYVSVGAIEPRFYDLLVQALGLPAREMHPQYDRSAWTVRKERFAAVFATRTRDEWVTALAGLDVCFAPVLAPWEVLDHPHVRARSGFADVDGFPEPAPAPRFGRTPSAAFRRPAPGEHTNEVFAELRWPPARVEALRTAGVIR